MPATRKQQIIYFLFFFLFLIHFQICYGIKIIDYQNHLNSKFRKTPRQSTRFIIIHTSEAGKKSSLMTLSSGKRISKKYRTNGGHSNYVISRKGLIYRILNPILRSDHAGKSLWNGTFDLSNHSIGIELVAFHYGKITSTQYRSLSKLLNILQTRFRIKDKNILTHAQIAYGEPNYWFKRLHRGRKKCGLNFDRQKAGLTGEYSYDPDVMAGRLIQDPIIKKAFYNKKFTKYILPAKKRTVQKSKVNLSNIIDPSHTAWSIAGDEYNSESTIYILPDGKRIPGNLIKHKIGWSELPKGTEVLLNQTEERNRLPGPVYIISKSNTAWSFAGRKYRSKTTFYLYPDENLVRGDRIPDWDSIPENTSLIIDYNNPIEIKAIPGKTAWGIAGHLSNHKSTIYFIPKKGFITGDKILDFSNLPKGSTIFLRKQ